MRGVERLHASQARVFGGYGYMRRVHIDFPMLVWRIRHGVQWWRLQVRDRRVLEPTSARMPLW